MPTSSSVAAQARGAGLAILHQGRIPLLRGWAIVVKLAAAIMRLPVWLVLTVLIALQWAVVGIIASLSAHNGFVFYNGGDDTWYYTSAWVLGHGHVPNASVGYGYPLLLAPLARLGGPNLLAGLPYVIGLNLLVLWPIAVCCVYGIAKLIGGRGYAYLATLAWTVLPALSIPYFYERYHFRYINVTLAPSLGLTALADFPGMVCLLIAGYFGLQAVTLRQSPDALFAGLAAGLAIAVKPSNAVFLPAPVAALVIARYGRGLLELAVGLAPVAVALALWKYRGIGYLPLLQNAPASSALGRFTDVPLGGLSIHKYVPLNWGQLQNNIDYIREYAWSLRLLTWIIAAGAIGLARRSGAGAVLILTWLASYVLLKGSSPVVNVKSGSFFRYMAPAFPAFFLLAASIPLLVPVWGPRLAGSGRATVPWPTTQLAWKRLLRLAAVVSILPILALLVFRPLTTPDAARVTDFDQYVPANTFGLSATVDSTGSVLLDWPSQRASGARVSYFVFRTPIGATPPDGLTCTLQVHASATCAFYTDTLDRFIIPTATTFLTSWRDTPPHSGTWDYRVALRASESKQTSTGDFMMFSRAVTVTVP
jgi:hypothetical protein